MQTDAEFLTAPTLDHAGIRHGFFTRRGGVSDGIYRSLNCGLGSSDDRTLVLENRGRVCDALGVARDRLATPYQVHSPTALVTDRAWAPGEAPHADAVVTAMPGLAVAVGTADCGPLLFADPEARVVGAAHAGWRGAVSGVAEATIEAMISLGAARGRIHAVLGPMISQPSYEVGPELFERFVAEDPANAGHFAAAERAGHHMFDLPGYLARRLGKAGLASVTDLARCTYVEEELFYSFRRVTHRGEPDYGRLLAAIAISTD
ncbi:MAG TPA: peptidoglycan editing factor PgeF [Kaistiaceae bacterium]|nr:peptidoglycan editing factor PgeF [Kaistiaceae bacterium]